MRSAAGSAGATVRGLALDLGSARTRAWAPAAGLLADIPSRRAGAAPGGVAGPRPVRRGRVSDTASCARLLREVTDVALGTDRGDTVVVLSHPVLSSAGQREAARALVDALGAVRVVGVDSARAAAASAGIDSYGPLIVVDIGAELTEVTLLVDGMVSDARQAEIGVSDLGPDGSPHPVVASAAGLIEDMWQRDRNGAVLGALRRGVLLAGGGALHAGITNRLGLRLGVRLRRVDDPATAVVRGAGLMLGAVLRHPTAPRAPHGRQP